MIDHVESEIQTAVVCLACEPGSQLRRRCRTVGLFQQEIQEEIQQGYRKNCERDSTEDIPERARAMIGDTLLQDGLVRNAHQFPQVTLRFEKTLLGAS